MALGRISMQTDRRTTVRTANFVFIVLVNCSYEDDSLAASYQSKPIAAETIVNVAATLGASRVILVAPQRNAIVNLPRGNVIREVSRCSCEMMRCRGACAKGLTIYPAMPQAAQSHRATAIPDNF